MARDVTPSSLQPTAKRLPIFSQRGHVLREGDYLKVVGRNHWFRFTAYVIPVSGVGYVEAVQLKQKGKTPPRGEKDVVLTGGVRCLDPGSIRESARRS